MASQQLAFKEITTWQQLLAVYRFCILQNKQTHIYQGDYPVCSIDELPDRHMLLKNLLAKNERLAIVSSF